MNAVVMAGLAFPIAASLDRHVMDPEGSFLGPTWVRLPLLLLMAVAIDLIPRALWYGRAKPAAWGPIIRERLKSHWTKQRVILVFLGIICFYTVYVCYRNLKSFLPYIIETKYDHELHLIDRAIFFGHEPGTVLQQIFGTDIFVWPLSYIYLWFMPLVPIAVAIWLVWSRTLTYGYWFVTSQCIAWTLGTASYYALPTLGPGIAYPYVYSTLAHTPTTDLMNSLVNARHNVIIDGIAGVQSVAGFASLHCGITLLIALMVQYTIRHRVFRILAWVNFGLTVCATLYFGWHYVADDVAGICLALVSFYVGGVVSGHKFGRKGQVKREAALDARATETSA
ncbi:phosphatase PAP2 family protein [Nocardioides insulae]|uniref:phosphatase PAP2 family protein n=1 Tax=Nocardioides insulae TaxID=394734 RepID=UPI001FE126D7|nr:phosphatase PAP2 family protein [Nocardioides insulae]